MKTLPNESEIIKHYQEFFSTDKELSELFGISTSTARSLMDKAIFDMKQKYRDDSLLRKIEQAEEENKLM